VNARNTKTHQQTHVRTFWTIQNKLHYLTAVGNSTDPRPFFVLSYVVLTHKGCGRPEAVDEEAFEDKDYIYSILPETWGIQQAPHSTLWREE
jgi:hypothetical protein